MPHRSMDGTFENVQNISMTWLTLEDYQSDDIGILCCEHLAEICFNFFTRNLLFTKCKLLQTYLDTPDIVIHTVFHNSP